MKDSWNHPRIQHFQSMNVRFLVITKLQKALSLLTTNEKQVLTLCACVYVHRCVWCVENRGHHLQSHVVGRTAGSLSEPGAC